MILITEKITNNDDKFTAEPIPRVMSIRKNKTANSWEYDDDDVVDDDDHEDKSYFLLTELFFCPQNPWKKAQQTNYTTALAYRPISVAAKTAIPFKCVSFTDKFRMKKY